MPADENEDVRRVSAHAAHERQHVVNLERVHARDADDSRPDRREDALDGPGEAQIAQRDTVAARFERRADVLHAERFDAEEGTEAESLVAWRRTQEQKVHARVESWIILPRLHDVLRPTEAPGGTRLMQVCALIPAFNEEGTIADVVRGVAPHVAHVLVVDDGSTDETAARATAAGAEVLRHKSNSGKGLAIRSGLAAILARDFTHVLFLDGDMQHGPEEAKALIERARTGAGEFVLGERPFVRETMPASRYYTNTVSSWVISRLFVGTRVDDAQSGFRLISTAWLRRLRLSGRGYEIETEMLIKLARRGAVIDRVPISLRYHGAPSKLRPLRDTTRTCFLAVRYRFFPERFQ
jgi:hypothetical protein